MHGFAAVLPPQPAGLPPATAAPPQRGRADGGDEYAWERSYERSWEAVTEDAEGRLVAEPTRRTFATGRSDSELTAVQRGMLRHLFVVIDASRGMEATDLKPNRALATAAALKEFIGELCTCANLCSARLLPPRPTPRAAEFFDQNPISKLGLISTQQGTATKVSELGTNPRRHAERLDAAMAAKGARARGGDMSLATALEMALRTLELIPPYGTREVRWLRVRRGAGRE